MNFIFQQLQFNEAAELIVRPQNMTLPFSVYSMMPIVWWNGYMFRSENKMVKVFSLTEGKSLPDQDFEATWFCNSGDLFVFAIEDKMVGYADMNREPKKLHRLDNAGDHILDMRFVDKEHVVVLERNVASIYKITMEQQLCLGKIAFENGAYLILPSGNGERFAVMLYGYEVLFIDIPVK